jgi:hypothetical protein
VKQLTECLICGAGLQTGIAGMVAPFLACRIWGKESFPVSLLACSDCEFQFFSPRMDPEEEKRLYAGYRNPEYQQARFACEPWYTEKFNRNLSSPESFAVRKQCLAKTFREEIDLGSRKIGSILDFGGDRGDLIEDLLPGAERFVYDISGVEPVAGIRALRSLEDCQKRRFDLIVTSNVLEHVSSPCEFLRQIQKIAGPGTLIFNEVPWESPSSFATIAKRLVQESILILTRPKIGWSLLRPGMLQIMHEHVNYFSPLALDRLTRSMGWQVLASGVYSIGQSYVSSNKMAWSFARVD